MIYFKVEVFEFDIFIEEGGRKKGKGRYKN